MSNPDFLEISVTECSTKGPARVFIRNLRFCFQNSCCLWRQKLAKTLEILLTLNFMGKRHKEFSKYTLVCIYCKDYLGRPCYIRSILKDPSDYSRELLIDFLSTPEQENFRKHTVFALWFCNSKTHSQNPYVHTNNHSRSILYYFF